MRTPLWLCLAMSCVAANPQPATTTVVNTPPPGNAMPIPAPPVTARHLTAATLCSSLAISYCQRCQPGELETCMNAYTDGCLGNGTRNPREEMLPVGDAQRCLLAYHRLTCPQIEREAIPEQCRTASPEAGQTDVPLGLAVFCALAGDAFCTRCASTTATCLPQFVKGCVGTSDPTRMTQRTSRDISQCEADMGRADCARLINGQGGVPSSCDD
ncbi:MAG: hypothetical protein HY909_16700 [Deltaproteobacteria bacterium]|nr:hypothetical protein [Deltaproteobacteria bacterium]